MFASEEFVDGQSKSEDVEFFVISACEKLQGHVRLASNLRHFVARLTKLSRYSHVSYLGNEFVADENVVNNISLKVKIELTHLAVMQTFDRGMRDACDFGIKKFKKRK